MVALYRNKNKNLLFKNMYISFNSQFRDWQLQLVGFRQLSKVGVGKKMYKINLYKAFFVISSRSVPQFAFLELKILKKN
jgi:hypothetical protein